MSAYLRSGAFCVSPCCALLTVWFRGIGLYIYCFRTSMDQQDGFGIGAMGSMDDVSDTTLLRGLCCLLEFNVEFSILMNSIPGIYTTLFQTNDTVGQ